MNLCSGGSLSQRPPSHPLWWKSGRYASYLNAFLLNFSVYAKVDSMNAPIQYRTTNYSVISSPLINRRCEWTLKDIFGTADVEARGEISRSFSIVTATIAHARWIRIPLGELHAYYYIGQKRSQNLKKKKTVKVNIVKFHL